MELVALGFFLGFVFATSMAHIAGWLSNPEEKPKERTMFDEMTEKDSFQKYKDRELRRLVMMEKDFRTYKEDKAQAESDKQFSAWVKKYDETKGMGR